MKTKYKFIGLSKYAERNLCEEDTERLTEMIGCEIEESEYPSIADGGKMFIMPDGEGCHIDFLDIEEVQPEFDFEN